jgi:adenylate cyclase
MGVEIERKFLVDVALWKPVDAGIHFRQGYLSSHRERVVRVRIEGSEARLTIKGVTRGLTRAEFEYPIPMADARLLLAELCERPLLDKHRYREIHHSRTWEIDVFHGANAGLIVAEVELRAEDEVIDLPPWVGAEVSHDPRYFNANLAQHPFTAWPQG